MSFLFLAEGHAVGALIHAGVGFVGAYQDLIQGAVVLAGAVVCTLGNGALHALICVTAHCSYLLFLFSSLV